MKLADDGAGRWVFECAFAERGVPKAAGFRWDPARKVWWTDVSAKAAQLRAYAATGAVQSELQVAAQQAEILEREDELARERSRKLSLAATSTATFPVPEGREYLPFQRAGIEFALGRANTLIGDEMGLGKTVQALGIVNADPTIQNVLVICPASLKINWLREASRWLVRPTRIAVLDSRSRALPDADAVVAIVNYDIVEKLRPVIDSVAWDLLVLDEVHYLKSRDAKRTQAVYGRKASAYKSALLPIEATRKVALTGTPIPNRPIELWTTVHALDPQGLGKSWFTFATEYCAAQRTRYGFDSSGASNLDDLQARLRESILVRRLKADVLTELPPKRRQVIELPANGSAALVERERKSYERHQNLLGELRAAVAVAEISDNNDDYRAAVAALRSGQSAAFGELSKLRHEVALSKVPHAVEHIHDAVEGSGAVVVFAHHKDVVEQIREALAGREISVVTLTGDHALDARQAAVDTFQRGEAQVIILTIAAGGVGLTLTRAAHVVFVELDWVPGQLSQAEDRCHRIGQRESVLVQHVVLEGSLDAHMAATVIGKQEVIERALDGGGEKREDAQDALSAAIGATSEPAPQPDPKAACVAAERAAAALVTPEERADIHAALRQVNAGCDGALAEDGRGFSKVDAAFGRRLSEQDVLVGRQVIHARRLVIKYGRQVSPGLVARVRAIEIKVQQDPEIQLP